VQILDFIRGGGAGGVTGKPTLAGLHKLLRPGVIEALRDPLVAAQLADAVFTTQAIQHDPDLVFR